ncbi:hypothetical protein ES708_29117 [subsurface metagenome]
MTHRYSMDMTLEECDAFLADFVGRVGIRRVLNVAVVAARKSAGNRISALEKEFEFLGRVAVAAGLEDEKGEPDVPTA